MDLLKQKKFYFVRHGMTEWNQKQLCQGLKDIELNEAGRCEAHQLSEFLASFPFSSIYTSPLKRALETAQIIHAKLPNSQLQVVDDLKERNWGKLEGISSAEMYRIEEMEENESYSLPDESIEPRDAFKMRILSGLNHALGAEEPPLIVSHGRVFVVLCELLNLPLIRQIPNTTLIECSPSQFGWQIKLIKE